MLYWGSWPKLFWESICHFGQSTDEKDCFCLPEVPNLTSLNLFLTQIDSLHVVTKRWMRALDTAKVIKLDKTWNWEITLPVAPNNVENCDALFTRKTWEMCNLAITVHSEKQAEKIYKDVATTLEVLLKISAEASQRKCLISWLWVFRNQSSQSQTLQVQVAGNVHVEQVNLTTCSWSLQT